MIKKRGNFTYAKLNKDSTMSMLYMMSTYCGNQNKVKNNNQSRFMKKVKLVGSIGMMEGLLSSQTLAKQIEFNLKAQII